MFISTMPFVVFFQTGQKRRKNASRISGGVIPLFY
jgi:hypothetical protein